MRLKITSNLRPIINYDVLPVAGDDAPVLLNNREIHILRQLTYPYLVSGYAAYHPEGYVWYNELSDAERVAFGEESEILINKLGGGSVHTHSKLVPDDGAPNPAISVDAEGNADMAGTLLVGGSITASHDIYLGAGSLRGGAPSGVLNDECLVLTDAYTLGTLYIYSRHTTLKATSGIIVYRLEATAFCIAMVSNNVDCFTTELTNGTADGTDGKLNISVYGGVLTIKNRLNLTYSPGYLLLGQ